MIFQEKRCHEELYVIGKELYQWRKPPGQPKAKITQQEMGRRCGLHTNHLARLEKGQINADMQTLVKASFVVPLSFFGLLTPALTTLPPNEVPTPAAIAERLHVVLQTIGHGILHYIQLKGITQETLAFNAGIAYSEMSRYVNGHTNMQYLTLVKIAWELETDTRELLNTANVPSTTQ